MMAFGPLLHSMRKKRIKERIWNNLDSVIWYTSRELSMIIKLSPAEICSFLWRLEKLELVESKSMLVRKNRIRTYRKLLDINFSEVKQLWTETFSMKVVEI